MSNKPEEKTSIEVLKLLDLVYYQKGAVVSKTLIDNETGTVSIFAFDEDQKLSEHTVPYDALIYVLEGEVDVTISKKLNKLQKNEAIIMPANKPHALTATKKFKMLLSMVHV